MAIAAIRTPSHSLAVRCLLMLLPWLLSACASWRSDIGAGWQERIETGTAFRHRVIFKPGQGRELHIYLDGDGRIWRNADELAADPTPPHSLALQLMQLDPAPALLIGRPCYFQVDDSACAPRWWTSARYSGPVTESLIAVATRWARGYDGAVLIGYSGGGALAMLAAPQLPAAHAVITLAGNLDTDAWVRHHHYSAQVVGESPNPAAQTPLPATIAQRHYAGATDDNVLWPWIAAYSARQPKATFIKLEGFDHHCCWLQQWPALLDRPSTSGDQNSSRSQNSNRP